MIGYGTAGRVCWAAFALGLAFALIGMTASAHAALYRGQGAIFGMAGTGNGQFDHPADIAIDVLGDLWIVDQENDRLQKFSPDGEYLDQFGSSGSGPGQFGRPTAVAIDPEGDLWVADAENSRIAEFDDEGELIQTVGGPGSGTGNGEFWGPEGIAVDPEGNVWVSDSRNGRIQKFDEAGEFIEVVSSYGSGEGQVGEPVGIDIGVEGDVFVADWTNHRVSVFDPSGEFVRQFGSLGGEPGQFYHPDALEVDDAGNVWVGDEGYDRMLQFNEAGEFISWFGYGQFNVSYPFGIAIDGVGRILVTDSNNDRIQRWGYFPDCSEGSGETDSDQALEVEPGGIECEGTPPFEYTVVNGPEHGELSAFDSETGAFTYTPDPGYGGFDLIEFQVFNEFGSSAQTAFHLQVGNIPIAAYPFDELYGDLARDVFGGHDGTVEGAEWTADGKYGEALVFDGGSAVSVPDADDELDLTGDFTLEAWVRPHFPTGAGLVFAKEDSTSPLFGYVLYGQDYDAAPYARLAGSGFGEEELSGSEGAVPADVWSHVALTSNGSEAKLYVNGDLDDTSSSLAVRSSDGDFRIGGYPRFEQFFDGRIDEVRIYDATLTEAEIERDMDAPIASGERPEPPVAAYPFDEGEGAVAHDVARAHDGTVEGAEWVEEGLFGGALRFDGSKDEIVSIPAAADLDLSGAFTLEAWVWPDASEKWQPVLAKEAEASSSYALYAGGEESGVPEGMIGTAGEGAEMRVAAQEAIPAESWSHLAFTQDGEDLRIYVDGELEETAPSSTALLSEGKLSIGGHDALERYFSGLIDEVRIYDRALDVDEIGWDRDTNVGGPQVSVSGPIFAGAPGQLVSPDLGMTVDIHDSGREIEKIELLVDGESERTIPIEAAFADGATQDCVAGVCHVTYSFDAAAANELPPGPHVIGVRVTDRDELSTTRVRSVAFDVDQPELVLFGPLAFANGGPLEEEEALLEIEAKDGKAETDSGIKEIRIAVDGEIVQVDPFACEPKCPEPATSEFTYDKAEWGEGPHAVDVYAVDVAGNVTVETVLVDSVLEAAGPSCSSGAPSNEEPLEPISASEAKKLLKEKLPGAVAAYKEGFVTPFWDGSGEDFIAREAFTSGWLAKAPGGEFTTGSAACLVPTTSTSAETEASRFTDSAPTVIHANSGPRTDTAIRITPLGAAIIENVRGVGAPLSFSWKADLQAEEEFVELSSGAVALVKPDGTDLEPSEVPLFPAEGGDPEALSKSDVQLGASISEIASANEEVEGQVMAVIAPPVAVDGEGKLIEGELSASGQTITAVRPEGSVAMVLRVSSSPSPTAICAGSAPWNPSAYLEACGPDEAVDTTFVSGFDWMNDDYVVFALETFTESGEGGPVGSRLYRASFEGLDQEPLTGAGYLYFDPQVSRDGAKVVATRCDLDETDCGIRVMNADGSENEAVFADEVTGRDYSPTFGETSEEIYFFRDSVTGGKGKALERQLYYIDTAGTNERQVTDVSNTTGCPDEPPCNLGISSVPGPPSVDAEGEEIVFAHGGDIWQVEASAETAGLEEMTRLTENEGEEAASWPSYSQDGESILYYYAESPGGGAGDGIFTMDASGSEKTLVLAYSAGAGGAQAPQEEGEEVGFMHHGTIRAVDGGGLDERLVSDGEEAFRFSELVASAGEEAVETAEAVEARIEGIKMLISEPYDEVNDAEWAFCINNLYNAVECKYFKEDRGTAEDARGDIFTARFQFDRSTRGNAFQHAYWTGLMVRHSVDTCPVTDGLVFALLHEDEVTWDSKMDVLNDFVGSKYACGHDPEEDWKICEGLRIKSKRAFFMGSDIGPYHWADKHDFHYNHPVFRFVRSRAGKGPIVRLNGRDCSPPGDT